MHKTKGQKMSNTVLYGPPYVGKEKLAKDLGYTVWDMKDVANWIDTDTLVVPTKLVIVDYQLFYGMMTDRVCDEQGCEHPSDMGVGKAGVWRKITEEMQETLYTLSQACDSLYLLTDVKKETISHSLYTGDVMMPNLDWISEKLLPNIIDRTLALLPIYKTTKTDDGKTLRKESKIMICSLRPDVYAGDKTGELPRQIPEDTLIKTLTKKGA